MHKKMPYDFHVDDLEMGNQFYDRVIEEADRIGSKESTRNDRTDDQIYKTTLRGHRAEWFLITEKGFYNDPRPYKDVKSPDGDDVEVKVFTEKTFYDNMLKEEEKKRLQKWRKLPDIYMVWINEWNDEYRFAGTYRWNPVDEKFENILTEYGSEKKLAL